MGESVLLSRNPLPSPLTAMPSNASVSVLKDVPPELLRLPVGTVLPVSVVPPETPTGYAVLNITLPDGETVTFETKMAVPENFETQLSLKILPNENKDTLNIRLLPLEKSLQSIPKTIEKSAAFLPDAVVGDKSVFSGWLLKNLPQSVKETPLPFTPPLSDFGGKIDFQIQSVSPNVSDYAPSFFSETAKTTPVPEKIAAAPNVAENATKINAAGKTSPPDDFEQSAAVVSDTVSKDVSDKTDASARTTAAVQNPASATIETKTETTASNIPLLRPAIPVQPPENAENTSSSPLTPSPSFASEKQTTPKNVGGASSAFPALPPREKIDFPSHDANETTAFKTTPESTVPEKIVAAKTVQGILFQPKGAEPPVIASDIGVIALNQKINLPHMSLLSLKVVSAQTPDLPETTVAPEQNSPWAFLNDAFEGLQKTDPNAVESLKAVLPQVGNRLPTLMLSFMHAAATGADVRSWLGEANVQALQAMGKRGEAVLKNIEKEFSTAVKKGTDGKSLWKGYDIPLMTGTAVEPVSLYLQQSSEALEERSKNRPPPATAVRFVLDLNLTKLGRMQLEGLSQRANRSFNLNIRYVYPLSETVTARLGEIFSKTLDAMGYAGVCSLKRTDEFIEIRPETKTVEKKSGVWA